MQHQHFGIIIFSKYPIIKKRIISGYPNNYNSTFQYADIVKGTDTFRVFNVHLQSLRLSRTNLNYINKPSINGDEDLEKSKSLISKLKNGFIKRQLQADRIRSEMEKSPYPNIVCGDFNDVPNSYAYSAIGKGMKNAFVEKGSGMGRTFTGISPTLRIDNIFVDKRFDVEQFTRIKRNLSDHYPIIADVKKVNKE
ncbi:MAG: endonuclease/exonuclease/phosphatase family protein [Chitinophagaceae bacterium]|nr:endonuclease/exonuclease/phosphatase family protein [Chitinophagaceae bacterium]